MTRTCSGSPWQAGNPFATKHIRAGAMSYRFADGDDAKQFMHRLQSLGWTAQIVGPHGSGKTTLLRTLDQMWSETGRDVKTVSLHNGQHWMPSIDWLSVTPTTQIVVDGFEQLGRCSKLLLLARCRWSRCGLLITAHRRQIGLPVVFRSDTSMELACELVDRLTADIGETFDRTMVKRHFVANKGNLRETFLSLYDELCE